MKKKSLKIMNIALVVAAGSGSRMKNTQEPKQFVKVNDKPLMIYSLETFNVHPRIDSIIVVTNEAYINDVEQLCKQYKLNKVKAVVKGGATRQESVFHGLEKVISLSNNKDDIVLIHDAARPLVSLKIISSNIEKVKECDAVSTVIKASDTIVSCLDSETIDSIPDRKNLYQAQTPQTFKLAEIYNIHKANKDNNLATDDASLYIKSGKKVYLVEGDRSNFKITTDEDLLMLKGLLNSKR